MQLFSEKPSIKARIYAHFSFLALLFAVSALALSYFIQIAPTAETPIAALYKGSVLGYYGTLIALIGVLTLPLSLTVWTRWLISLTAWIWLVFLVVDIATFNLYRFHLNGMLVEMFLTDFRGMGIPPQLLALFSIVALCLLVLIFLLHRLVKKISIRRQAIGLLITLALLIPTFGANAVISMWANQFAREEVTQNNPFFPLYFSVVSHKHARAISAQWPNIFPPETGKGIVASSTQNGIVHYPLAAPTCTTKPEQSILLIAVESWQASSLTPEIMPNLSRFATTATRFNQHISSGAATVPGLFGLLYGIHPTYYDLFRAAPKSNPSFFTETLSRLGYRSRVFTSGGLDTFSMRTLFFSKVAATDYLDTPSDEKIIDAYLASLNTPNDSQPRFDFLFLTSSHASYNYPAEFARFKPLPLLEGGYATDPMTDATPYKNDYHNSLAYVDALLGKLFSNPAWQKKLANTWIVITGDHAEEFNENGLGFWGHGGNFSRWQTQTPLIVHRPAQTEPAIETRTSLHQDIVPTLMEEALHCKGQTSDYASGTNLFRLPEQRNTVISSYFGSAYWINGTILERNAGKKYAWDDVKQTRTLDTTQALRDLMNEERRFIAGAKTN